MIVEDISGFWTQIWQPKCIHASTNICDAITPLRCPRLAVDGGVQSTFRHVEFVFVTITTTVTHNYPSAPKKTDL